VAGQVQRGEGPEDVAVAERDVGRVAHRGDGRSAEPVGEGRHALRVVGVVVGEHDPARAATRLDSGGHRGDVRRQRRTGIHHPRGIAPDDPRVRAAQRHRRRIRRADEGDLDHFATNR
jgi:hypothetical protein